MKKIFAIPIVLAGFVNIATAFNASLNLDTNQQDINNPITLNLKIESDKVGQIAVKHIKWLENFDIVGQNQMQSTSMQMININGHIEQKAVTTYNVILKLLAHKQWTYTIWPALIQVGNKEYKTNSVNVKITGQKIMLNNSQNTLQQLQTKSNLPVWQTHTFNVKNNSQNTNSQSTNQQNLLENFKNQNIKIKENNYTIYYIIAIILLLWLIFVFWVLNNEKEIINEKVEKNNEKEDNKTNLEAQIINHNLENIKNWKLSFLEKYWIQNPETKTYTEITNYLKENNINLTEQEKKILEDELIGKYRTG